MSIQLKRKLLQQQVLEEEQKRKLQPPIVLTLNPATEMLGTNEAQAYYRYLGKYRGYKVHALLYVWPWDITPWDRKIDYEPLILLEKKGKIVAALSRIHYTWFLYKIDQPLFAFYPSGHTPIPLSLKEGNSVIALDKEAVPFENFLRMAFLKIAIIEERELKRGRRRRINIVYRPLKKSLMREADFGDKVLREYLDKAVEKLES